MDHSVYGVWHGGVNYAQGTREDDLEVFDSIRAAKDALLERARHGHGWQQEFSYVNRDAVSTYTPCADEGASIALYTSPTAEEPFRLLELGPRGGVKETAL